MTVRKGDPWGAPGPLPDDGVVVRSDAEARRVLTEARAGNRPFPTLGLLGGDLCRTLGGGGRDDAERLRSHDAMTFPVDVGEVLVDGRLHLFVAHLVARNGWWTRAFVAMNAQFIGDLDLGPRSHPGDGLLDTFDARLAVSQLPQVRRRARTGSHLPHPGIKERRTSATQVELDRPLGVWLDGERVGRGRVLSVRLQPDAVRVVV
jgi:hypothetical protein